MRNAASLTPDPEAPWARLRVAALTPFTSLDFPGHLAAIMHLQGCPLACPYCHSPHLQPFGPGALSPRALTGFLASRRGLLDGIVFSGGEPCAQIGLGDALAACRAQGYATALHSAGVYPHALIRLLPLLDWIGLDWKAPLHDTAPATGRVGLGRRFAQAVHAVLSAGIAHEIRTTWHPALLPPSAMLVMAEQLAQMGAGAWVIQPYWRPVFTTYSASPPLGEAVFPRTLLTQIRAILPNTILRP